MRSSFAAGYDKHERGFELFAKWALSQRIRTIAEFRLTVAIVPKRLPAPYEQVADRAAKLRTLGMSKRAIGRALGVHHVTVSRALEWFDRRHS